MFTGLAVAVGLMAATANNQPEVSPTVPPHSASTAVETTPFRSGFSQPGLLPDAVIFDHVDGDQSDPDDEVVDASEYEAITSDDDGYCPCDDCDACGPGDPCDLCGDCGGFGKAKPPKMEHCWTIRCDMPQHITYYPPYHENYYFRPYSVAHLARQQEIVTSWGGDPRNPYANSIFQRVYDEMSQETVETPEPNVIPQPTPDADAGTDEPAT